MKRRQSEVDQNTPDLPPHQLAWDRYLNSATYARVPRSYLDHVTRACSSALQQNVVLHVLFETVGAIPVRGVRPEWCAVPMRKLAELYGATVNGVDGAVRKVVEAGILETKKIGRANQYRVLFQNWNASLKPIELDGVDGEDSEDGPESDDEPPADELQSAPGAIVLRRGRTSPPIAFTEPVERARLVNRCRAAVAVNHEIVDGVLRVTISDAAVEQQGEHAANDLPTPLGDSSNEGALETPSAVGSSSLQVADSTSVPTALDQLTDRLDTFLRTHVQPALRTPPPAEMVRQAANRLLCGDRTVDDFEHVLSSGRRMRKFHSWGFLSHVIQDTLNAAPVQPVEPQTPDSPSDLELAQFEYREQAHAEAVRIVAKMEEGRLKALRAAAEARLRVDARWERLTATVREREIRAEVVREVAASDQVTPFDTWLRQREALLTEEAHHA